MNRVRWLNTKTRWGMIAIVFHWASAITVFGLFGLGLWMVELDYYDPWYRAAPEIHQSIGVLLFLATLARLLWRRINRRPAASSRYTRFEQSMAIVMHFVLYLLLLVIMFSGYAISTADGHAIKVFNLLDVPPTLYGFDNQEDLAGVIHLWLALSLISLTIFHAMAALKHRFFWSSSNIWRFNDQ